MAPKRPKPERTPASIPPPANGRQLLLAILVILAAFLLAHGARVQANYLQIHWEDRVFIRHNQTMIHSFWDCFTQRPVWPGLYRPLTTNLYYFLGRCLFSDDIGIYHLINALLYLANGLLLYFICLGLLPGRWSLLPPALFVSRFSHVEVVSNTCEFQGLLCAFFTLLAFRLFMRGPARNRPLFRALSMAAFVLALFSKETALVLPAALFLYTRLFDNSRNWRSHLAYVAVAAVWIVLFLVFFRATSGFAPPGFGYDFGPSNVLQNYAAYFLAFFDVLTYRLESVVMVPSIAKMAATAWAKIAAAILVLGSLLFVVSQKRADRGVAVPGRVLAFGFLWFVIAASPYVVLVSRSFMRYAYLGHAGLSICAAVLARETMALARRKWGDAEPAPVRTRKGM